MLDNRSRHLRCLTAALLNQGRNDRSVRTPQASDGDMIANTPLRCGLGEVRKRDGLAEHREVSERNTRDAAYHFARNINSARRQRSALWMRNDANYLTEFQVVDHCVISVDVNGDILRIGDVQVVHENASEALNRANDSCAADAFVSLVFLRRWRNARAANPLIKRLSEEDAARGRKEGWEAGEECQNPSARMLIAHRSRPCA